MGVYVSETRTCNRRTRKQQLATRFALERNASTVVGSTASRLLALGFHGTVVDGGFSLRLTV